MANGNISHNIWCNMFLVSTISARVTNVPKPLIIYINLFLNRQKCD